MRRPNRKAHRCNPRYLGNKKRVEKSTAKAKALKEQQFQRTEDWTASGMASTTHAVILTLIAFCGFSNTPSRPVRPKMAHFSSSTATLVTHPAAWKRDHP